MVFNGSVDGEGFSHVNFEGGAWWACLIAAGQRCGERHAW